MYGYVKSGKYWNKTFIPLLCNNILDYNQPIFDPSLLFSLNRPAATAVCTDDSPTFKSTYKISEEAKIFERFKSRDATGLPFDFKGMDLIRQGNHIIMSQPAYAEKMTIFQDLVNAS